MVNDRLVAAVLDANSRIPDVTFLALVGRPTCPVTLCVCADSLIPLTLYQGADLAEALTALSSAVASLEAVQTE